MADDTNGAGRVQVAHNRYKTDTSLPDYVIDYLDNDLGEGRNNVPKTTPGGEEAGRVRRIIAIGETDLTNDAMKKTIADIAVDPDGMNKEYLEGKHDCMSFARQLIAKLCPSTPENPAFKDLADKYERRWQIKEEEWGAGIEETLGIQHRKVTVWGDSSKNSVQPFTIDKNGKVTAGTVHADVTDSLTQDHLRSVGNVDRAPILDHPYEAFDFEKKGAKAPGPWIGSSVFESFGGSGSSSDGGFCPRSLEDLQKRQACRTPLQPGKAVGPSELSVGFIDGKLGIVPLLTRTAFEGLGIAGAVLGPLFVVLDFINKDWTGAGFAAFVSKRLHIGLDADNLGHRLWGYPWVAGGRTRRLHSGHFVGRAI